MSDWYRARLDCFRYVLSVSAWDRIQSGSSAYTGQTLISNYENESLELRTHRQMKTALQLALTDQHQTQLSEPLISKVTASFTIFLRDSNTHTCMILTQLTYLVLVMCLISKHRSNCDNRNWCCGLFHNPSLIVNRRRTEDRNNGNHLVYIRFHSRTDW